MLKIGIIGCGGIANGKHLPALAKLEDVQMVAFCDVVGRRAEEQVKNTVLKDQKFILTIKNY